VWSYDQEIRRQMCRERIDQMARDARAPIAGRRRRRWAEIARRIAMSPAAYRARRPSYGS
jgi:hypothetical protein